MDVVTESSHACALAWAPYHHPHLPSPSSCWRIHSPGGSVGVGDPGRHPPSKSTITWKDEDRVSSSEAYPSTKYPTGL